MAARTVFADAHLFLDAFEDDDVRIGRHADRQDHARDARQRQRDRYQQDQAVEERRVDQQRDVGDEAQEPVEDEHVDHHDEQADDARDQALASESLPSVAETCVCESVLNSTGSEPDCSTSAMSLASCARRGP